ncbi:hypothetical protein VKT23_020655 [Stygiomarasmius scandens]|uniref:F-box domain-containing protein n=1 Tax=Marasmiellus scandens TaxID=2682957 RepID=A0ABR1IIV2_9AGAR
MTPTHVEDLMRSLSPLSRSDIVAVPRMFAKIDEEVERYERDILQLESRIVYLRSKQEFLKRKKDRLKSLTAPVRRLPTEVLSLIFINLCGDDGVVFAYDQSTPPLPFILTFVCHRWREVAIATPQIWSRIRLDESLDDGDIDSHTLFVPLQMALERSKGLPLSIYVGSRFIDRETSPLLDLLATQSQRWVDAHFVRLLKTAFQNAVIKTPLLLLQRLAVVDDGTDGNSFSMYAPDLCLFGDAPNLQALSIEVFPDDMVAPWDQIQHLELHLCRQEKMVKTLGLCSNLESVIFTTFELGSESDMDLDSLEHQVSNLHQVEFRMTTSCSETDYGMSLSDLLNALTLPEVHTMKFTRDCYPKGCYHSQWPRSHIDSFFQRSNCSLTTLYIDGHDISDKDALALLALTPMLTRLRLQEPRAHVNNPNGQFELHSISPLFLQTLHAFNYNAVSVCSSPLVPKLTSLHFTANASFNDALFGDMVVSRWIPEVDHAAVVGVECLRSVKLCVFGREFDQVQRKRLECLKSVGLEVDISQMG